MNKHFSSGRSQIFTIKNSTHEIHAQQTTELVRIMFGFFDGSLRGHFELKPRVLLSNSEIDAKNLAGRKEKRIAKL